MSGWVAALLAFLITSLLLRFLRPAAVRIDLIDYPELRKTHPDAVPLTGGLAMFCGFVFAALTLDLGLTSYRSFVAASAVLVVTGVLDDLRELSPPARFAAQIAAALLMAYWGGMVLHDLGGLRAGDAVFALGGWEVALTVFATVGVINALNMSDGLDGLAGGLALVPLLGLAWIAWQAGLADKAQILLLLAAVVVAFLLFNMPLPWRAQPLAFMGDSGAMFLGFAITWFFIDLSQGPERSMTPVTALWLLLLPLFDTVWLIARRLMKGRSPFAADLEHLHHLLLMAGLTRAQVTWILWGVAAACAVIGLAALYLGVSQRLMFRLFLALFALYCLLMAWSWWRGRLLLRPLDRRLGPAERRGGGERRRGERRSGHERRAEGDRRAVPCGGEGRREAD